MKVGEIGPSGDAVHDVGFGNAQPKRAPAQGIDLCFQRFLEDRFSLVCPFFQDGTQQTVGVWHGRTGLGMQVRLWPGLG